MVKAAKNGPLKRPSVGLTIRRTAMTVRRTEAKNIVITAKKAHAGEGRDQGG